MALVLAGQASSTLSPKRKARSRGTGAWPLGAMEGIGHGDHGLQCGSVEQGYFQTSKQADANHAAHRSLIVLA